jgi:hypothetical protein
MLLGTSQVTPRRALTETPRKALAEAETPRKARARAHHDRRAKERYATLLRERDLEHAWCAKTFKPTPSRFLGLRPSTQEPWAHDASGQLVLTDTGAAEPYVDECVLDSNHPDADTRYVTRVTATGLAHKADQPAWDSSPVRHAPHALRGIKLLPFHREPWAVRS